jgi:hypothetical protein
LGHVVDVDVVAEVFLSCDGEDGRSARTILTMRKKGGYEGIGKVLVFKRFIDFVFSIPIKMEY